MLINFFAHLICNILLKVNQFTNAPMLNCENNANITEDNNKTILSCVGDINITEMNFKVYFYLSTSTNRSSYLINKNDKGELKRTLEKQNFNVNYPTVVIIHGFLNDHNTPWVQQLKGNLMQLEKLNVIEVNWSDGFFQTYASTRTFNIVPDYTSAAFGTWKAAVELREILMEIANQTHSGERLNEKLHLIGHSLGAHVAIQTAKLLKKVYRVTALDPAYPCFDTDKDIWLRFNRNHATFVDVIHTNSRPGNNDGLGIYKPIGHMDFYPHGGFNQPACDLNKQGKFLQHFSLERTAKTIYEEMLRFIVKKFTKVDVTDIAKAYRNHPRSDIICDHGQAPKYFIESLRRKIYAVPMNQSVNENIETLDNQIRTCDKECVVMGYDAYKYASKPGIYYTDTTIYRI